jgi:replicative DNA helicase
VTRQRRQADPLRVDPDEALPPHSLDTEVAVLASCLLRREAAEMALEQLTPEDFWRDAHQCIFRSIAIVVERRLTPDLVTVCETLQQRGEADRVGGKFYLMSLIDGTPITTNIESYCKILIDLRHRRDLLDISRRLAAQVSVHDVDALALAAQAEGWLAEVLTTRGSRELQPQRDILQTFIPALEARMAGREELMGISSGFKGIDELTRGFHPEDLTILAARPSMGKSSLMLNMAAAAAASGAHVAVFSLEMSKERLEYRLVSARSQVSMFRIQKGWLNNEHVERISAALVTLSTHPLYIDDTPGLTVPQMKHKCRAVRATRGLDLVFVDYVQLLRPTVERRDNRQADVAEISYDLKELARKLRVPVVALSQLSREVERRSNKRPVLSDLRESGSLEQDADNVAFIYRPEVYTSKPEDAGTTEYILAKARDGDIGVVNLDFRKDHVRFYDGEDQPVVSPALPPVPPAQRDVLAEAYD